MNFISRLLHGVHCHTSTGASIVGLVEEPIDTLEKGLAFLKKGSNLRSIGTTAMNSGSSRSHALVFLTVKARHLALCTCTHVKCVTSLISVKVALYTSYHGQEVGN